MRNVFLLFLFILLFIIIYTIIVDNLNCVCYLFYTIFFANN